MSELIREMTQNSLIEMVAGSSAPNPCTDVTKWHAGFVPALLCPLFTLCEAGVWIQVFLRLLHRDLFHFRLDINGASLRGAGVIQFLDTKEKDSQEAA